MRAAGQTVVVYPDAPHGFHVDYRQHDAEDAWRRALAWLHRYGMGQKPRLTVTIL